MISCGDPPPTFPKVFFRPGIIQNFTFVIEQFRKTIRNEHDADPGLQRYGLQLVLKNGHGAQGHALFKLQTHLSLKRFS